MNELPSPDYQDGFNTANERADERIRGLEVENTRLREALSRLTASMEGVDTPFTDEQEAAYEAAASLLDDLTGD